MKKFNDTNVGLFVLLTTCLSLFSCNNDNDNFPKDYVGFENPPEPLSVTRINPKVSCRLKL